MEWDGPALPCAHLGVVFQYICETRGFAPMGLADRLTAEGFAVTPAECADIGLGRYLPDDGETFARACQNALRLTDGELRALLNQYAVDVLRRVLGEDLASVVLHQALRV
jgi:hypothetical protein